MAIIARFTRTLPAPSATISGGFVFLLSAGWFTQADTGVAGSPIDGGTNSLANGGGDIKIFSDALASTQLPLHVVSFVTGGSPVAQVWVRTSSYTSGDTITIGKDDTQTVQPIVSSTYGRNATWVDFEVNYHFNSSNDLIDSTGNHDLTEIGTVTSVTGKVGDAVDCSGSYSNRFEATGYKGVTGGSARTLTAWCNNTSSDNRGLATWGSAATAKRWSIWFNGGKFRTEIDGSFRQSTSGSSGTFKRFSSILTGSSFPSNSRHRIDGSTTTGDSVGGAQTVNTGSSSDMKVAAYSNLSSVAHGSNITDELSLRSFAISDDQDLSEYTNQSDPDNFGTSSEWVLVGSSGITITATLGAIDYSSQDAIVSLAGSIDLTTTLGAISYSSQSATVSLTGSVDVTTTLGSINYTSQNATVSVTGDIDIISTLGSISYSSNNAVVNVSSDIIINAVLGVIDYTSQDAIVALSGLIDVNTILGSIVYNSYNVSVSLGDGQVIGNVTTSFKDDIYTSGFKPSAITVNFK